MKGAIKGSMINFLCLLFVFRPVIHMCIVSVLNRLGTLLHICSFVPEREVKRLEC